MKCKCKSYNMDGDGSMNIVLPLPDWVDPKKEVRTVSIEPCIVGVILYLWVRKVNTFGCCCGHNKENPDITIGQEHKNYDEIRNWIREVDDREWDIFQWTKKGRENVFNKEQ